MAKLKWDQIGEKTYETGVDHGILYPQKDGEYPLGVAWSGLITITENASGAEDTPLYADNIKYLNLKSNEEFGATLECYAYPPEWAACNGESNPAPGLIIGQQRRNTFGLCYRTKKGNDTEGEDYGFKLHLLYGGSASPSERAYETVNDSPDAITFSFEISTTPIPLSGKDPSTGKPFKPVSIIIIDSTEADPDTLKKLEDILQGTEDTEPRLPLPDEVYQLFTLDNSEVVQTSSFSNYKE